VESLSEVDIQDFDAALSPSQVRPPQLIAAGMALGVVVLGGIVVFFHTQELLDREGFQSLSLPLIQILTGVHFVVFCGCYLAGMLLYNTQFSRTRLSKAAQRVYKDTRGQPVTSPAGKCLAIIRTAIILRLALLDAAANFGLATCLLAAMGGVLSEHPEYWANAATGVFLIAYVLVTFPTPDRVRNIFLDKIAAGPRYG